MDSEPDATPPGFAVVDESILAHPAIDAAFQLEADYSRWDRWTLEFPEGHIFPPCGHPHCANGCAGPLDTGMWCQNCFLDHNIGFEKCTLVDQYLKDELCREQILTTHNAADFVKDYRAMKSDIMAGETPSSCLASLDGRLCHALDKASELVAEAQHALHKDRFTVGPVRCSSKLSELDEALALIRRENVRISNAALRMRKRWMYMSDVVNRSITILYDQGSDPAKALEEGRQLLWRCQYMRLLIET